MWECNSWINQCDKKSIEDCPKGTCLYQTRISFGKNKYQLVKTNQLANSYIDWQKQITPCSSMHQPNFVNTFIMISKVICCNNNPKLNVSKTVWSARSLWAAQINKSDFNWKQP